MEKFCLLFLFLLPQVLTQKWLPFGQEEYYVGTSESTLSEARNSCNSMNSKLAIVSNSKAQEFLEKSITNIKVLGGVKPHSFWIGLSRNSSRSNNFSWNDGSALKFSFWSTNEPSINSEDSVEDCVIMGHFCCDIMPRKWYNVPCLGKTSGFICQRKMSEGLQSTLSTSVLLTSQPNTTQSTILPSTTSQLTSFKTTPIKTTTLSSQSYPSSSTSQPHTSSSTSRSFTSGSSTNSSTHVMTKQIENSSTSQPSNHSITIHYYIIPAVIAIVLLILLVVILVMYQRKGRPRTRSIGKVKVRAQTSVYQSTNTDHMKNNDQESDEFDEFDDDDDDDDDNDDDFHVEEDVYQSTASMENPRENIDQNETSNSYDDDHTRPYESVSSMELVDEKKIPRRHYYTKVNKSRNPTKRKSMEILDDGENSCYTEISDSAKVPQPKKSSKEPDVEAYVSVEEMEALSRSTYSLRISREISLKHHTIGEVYNNLVQS